MYSPKVTIGLSFKDNAHTLLFAIQSIFAQTVDNWELILINDGSQDSSLEIVSKIRDPRVKVLNDGTNQGLAYRLNQIAQLAKGTYLARMDADDAMLPERLKDQVELLESAPDLDVVGSHAYIIESKNRVIGKRIMDPRFSKSALHVLRKGIFIHPTITGRTKWFRRNPYNIHFTRSQDRELWCRTYLNSNFAYVDKPLLLYREHGSFSIFKYLKNSKFNRQIYMKLGPSLVGWHNVGFLIAESFLKDVIYLIFSLLKRTDHLLQKRSKKLSTTEMRTVSEIVKLIQDTPVPGIHR